MNFEASLQSGDQTAVVHMVMMMIMMVMMIMMMMVKKVMSDLVFSVLNCGMRVVMVSIVVKRATADDSANFHVRD